MLQGIVALRDERSARHVVLCCGGGEAVRGWIGYGVVLTVKMHEAAFSSVACGRIELPTVCIYNRFRRGVLQTICHRSRAIQRLGRDHLSCCVVRMSLLAR